MTDFKLVPVEPTPEMLDAAVQDGICVDGKPVWKRDVVFQAKWKYQQMLAAAPAVHGEPLGYVVPRMAARLGEGELCGISVLDQPEDGHTLPVYLTPQPTPDVTQLVEALEWYAEKVKGCRKIGAEGDNARQALDLDGGFRALDALAIHYKGDKT